MKKNELKELYLLMFPEYPDIITTAQLQEMLGISRRLAYQLINDGSIPGILIGNTYKIPKANVINYFIDEKIINQQPDLIRRIIYNSIDGASS